ncbi:MAG: NUDIX hydrolase [Desulfobacteraceae bacterium]|jgi:ADP-ribose pyrophosphatase
MEKKIRTVGSLTSHGFSVHLDEVLLKNGRVGQRIKIDHPEAAAIIPFISEHEIVMVRQFRYALGRETLEIPAGKMDPGETAEACVKRELLEETGYEADEIRLIYTYAPAIGYSNELIHIYSGHNLRKINASIDEREISSVERLSLERLRGMIRQGLVLDGKTLLGLSIIGLIAVDVR